MNDNVVAFTGETLLDIPTERILQSAIDNRLDVAVIVGRDAEGKFYFASSSGDIAEILLMLEVAKKDLLDEVLQ